jgi:ribosome biogenesis GTPase
LTASDAVEDSFSDIHGLAAHCQYADCRHIQEPGCAVPMAAESGSVSEDRYRNYLKLKKEADFHERSYAEKRRKDKAFGQYIKFAKKQFEK